MRVRAISDSNRLEALVSLVGLALLVFGLVEVEVGMLLACWRRKTRHERPERSPAGPMPAWCRIFQTVVAETVTPSPLSSPTIRW